MGPKKHRSQNGSFDAKRNMKIEDYFSQDAVVRQTCSGTTVGHSPSDTSECSGTVALKREVSGCEASLGSRQPNLRSSDKCYFKFTFKEVSRRSDRSVFTARGELNESVFSALKSHDSFRKRMENHFNNKDIFVRGQKAIEGYINLGMPLKCLPKGSHLEISVHQRKGNQNVDDQILRPYENPSIECILFHVVAVGRTIKRIVKNMALHEKGSTLCIYALKGETVKEALCKDGRFRSDLGEIDWELRETHTNIHVKQSTVEEVAGKVLEVDISVKPSARKHNLKKIEQRTENATGDISPYDVMPSQSQAHEPEKDEESEDVQHDREKVLPPQHPRHDIQGKIHRTISRIKSYYRNSLNRKYRTQRSCNQQRPRLGMECALIQHIQGSATNPWPKNCKMLDSGIMQHYPNFSEDARWMRNYFWKERRKTKLSLCQQFRIYEKCFAKVTKDSTSVATYEHRVHLSKSVGFLRWDNNGNKGNATCFVFSDGYIFTCRHVVHLMVGEDTDTSLWPDIISKCAKVTFTYKEFYPLDEEWFSLEPGFVVSYEGLDYAILKLRENGNGFPPGLVGQISFLPSSGLIYLIGHPEGRTKEIDECAVITQIERLKRYSEHYQQEVGGLHAATYGVCSMFTPRTFPPEAYSTNTLSYDTCFTSGSSGSPVFNAEGKVVALHAFGKFYKRGGKEYALIEFGYSMVSILCDLEQRNESFYKLLTGENARTSIKRKITNKSRYFKRPTWSPWNTREKNEPR